MKLNAEYIGLMYLHAARHHVSKCLQIWTRNGVLRGRVVLPYMLTVKDGKVGVTNRWYKTLGNDDHRWEVWEDKKNFFLPPDKFKASTKKDGDIYLFNDNCPPWRSREACEAYLASLERLIDFNTEGL